jgi:hypothetical protein
MIAIKPAWSCSTVPITSEAAAVRLHAKAKLAEPSKTAKPCGD